LKSLKGAVDARGARDLLGLQIDFLTDTYGTGFSFKPAPPA
jgi:Fe-S cluster assembly iron-binding protein IscA